MSSLPLFNAKGHLEIAGRDAVDLARRYGTPLMVYDVAHILDNVEHYRRAFDAHPVPCVVSATTARKEYAEHGGSASRLPVEAQGSPSCPSPAWAPAKYQIAYASKALSIEAIYHLLKDERNVAVDVVSGGELYTALRAGVCPGKIHFHGNNKSEEELRYALQARIGCVVVDSFHEIALLQRLTEELRRDYDARVAMSSTQQSIAPPPVVNVLLRVSPGVTAHTHAHNTTGQVDSKFGFDVASGQAKLALDLVSGAKTFAQLAELCTSNNKTNNSSNHDGGDDSTVNGIRTDTVQETNATSAPSPTARPLLRVVGLHCHIGSQIFSVEGHVLAARRLLDLAYVWGLLPRVRRDELVSSAVDPESVEDSNSTRRFVLNVGGGYGIAYTDADSPLPARAFIDALLRTVVDFLSEKRQAEHRACADRGGPPLGDFIFPELWMEPGRSLVGAAGTTLYTIGARKLIPALGKHYVAVDGGMSDNIRPVLYQARYTAYVANRMRAHARFASLSASEQQRACATLPSNGTDTSDACADTLMENRALLASILRGCGVPVTATTSTAGADVVQGPGEPAAVHEADMMEICTVVGKLCETGDQLIRDIPLPTTTSRGDILAVLCTGAYGYAMASNYNRIPRPAIVFVDRRLTRAGSDTAGEWIAVQRESYEDLVRNDRLP